MSKAIYVGVLIVFGLTVASIRAGNVTWEEDIIASGEEVDDSSGEEDKSPQVVSILHNTTQESSIQASSTENASSVLSQADIVDFRHPARSVRIMYVHSREKINAWMDDPLMRSFVIPALIGLASGVCVVACFFVVSALCARDRRHASHTLVSRSMPNIAEEKKKLVEDTTDNTDSIVLV